MEQEQGETIMVEIKKDMIKFSTDKELSKNEYRNWTNFVEQHNHDNPNDQICYEVVWNPKTPKPLEFQKFQLIKNLLLISTKSSRGWN